MLRGINFSRVGQNQPNVRVDFIIKLKLVVPFFNSKFSYIPLNLPLVNESLILEPLVYPWVELRLAAGRRGVPMSHMNY